MVLPFPARNLGPGPRHTNRVPQVNIGGPSPDLSNRPGAKDPPGALESRNSIGGELPHSGRVLSTGSISEHVFGRDKLAL